MSCKRKPENIVFSVSFTPDKKLKVEEQEDVIVAVLAPFNPFPKVSFEKVKLGSTVAREVYLVNPTENVVQVELSKLPDEARGYQWSSTEFELPSGSQDKLIITWTPTEYGSWHDNIKILNKKTKKPLSELKLTTTTEEPPKVAKRSVRSKGSLAKRSSNISKQVTVTKASKPSTGHKTSENKENESYLVCKSKKQTQSKGILQNENIIIYESKRLLKNKTFTQTETGDFSVQQCISTSVSYTTLSPTSITSSQSSRPSHLGSSTSRRGTFDVIQPAITSRRSTYSLRNKQLTSIADVEKEKKEFDLMASPGVQNNSLEIAASRLVSGSQSGNNKVGLTVVDETEPLVASGSSMTFTIPSTVSCNVLEVPCTPRRSTYDVSVPSLAASSYQSAVSHPLLGDNRSSVRISLDSIAGSEKFYDSLEEKLSKVDKDENPLDNWDEIYEFERFSLSSEGSNKQISFQDLVEEIDNSIRSNSSIKYSDGNCNVSNAVKLIGIKTSSDKVSLDLTKIVSLNETFSKLDEGIDERLDNLAVSATNHNHEATFVKHLQAAPSNLSLDSPHPNITMRSKTGNISSSDLPNCEEEFDCLENLNSDLSNNPNQNKGTVLELDKEFDKSNFNIVSSSRRNSEVIPSVQLNNLKRNRQASSSNLNKTFTPVKIGSSTVENADESFEERTYSRPASNSQVQCVKNSNVKEIHFNKHTNKIKINNPDHTAEIKQDENNVCFIEQIISESLINNEEEVSIPKGSHSDLSLQTGALQEVQTHNSLPEKQILVSPAEISTVSKPNLIWDISPPKNDKEEITVSKKIKTTSFPKIKRSLRTINTKSSLTHLTGKDLVNFKDKLNLKRNNNENPTESSSSSVDCSGHKRSNNPEVQSEEVFVVPTLRITRSSLLKSSNCSPPKIRKISQDPKVKRLSTPSTFRKLPVTSMTEERKKCSTEIPRSLSRPSTGTTKRKNLKVADWVPVVRKLKLSYASSQSEEDLSTSVESATPDPFLAATSLNPFAEGGLYFSNKWLNEQEDELLQWTDRMLRPPNELELDREQSEHSTLHRLNALRATAYSILTSTEVATVLSKIKVAVDRKIICIRSDRQLHADLGLQDKIITLLMNYNPLWLRLGLEALYQCNIRLKCHSDEAGLRDFIRKYVLSDNYLRETYSHPTIPYLMLPAFEEEMKKFTVYKFLALVYLLDLVKRKKVILHDPCLFKKESKLKSSKEILIDFNKDFVSGAGDIIKKLRLRGYEVSHCQTYIDEFDFSLKNRSELRDGVRLTRLAENLVGENSLCSKLRVPAISNLQKKFNAEVAFTALKNAGYDLPENISPKDISDGHKEKTLSFLWHIRGIIKRRAVLLIITKWRETKELRRDRKKFIKIRSSVIKIQQWYRKRKQAGKLSDEEEKKGKEDRERFLKLKTAVVNVQRRFRKKREEREIKKKSKAAVKIQKWYKNKKESLKDRNHFVACKVAAIKIQRAYRSYRKKKDHSSERQYFINLKSAAVTIQRRFRANKLAKDGRLNFLKTKNAILTIQRKFRALQEARLENHNFVKLRTATITIQRRFRAIKLARNQRDNFLIIKTATITIQKRLREFKIAKVQRQEFLAIKTAALVVQRRFRAIKISKHEKQKFLGLKTATVTIQRRFRANQQAMCKRQEFMTKRNAAITIQRHYRAFQLVKYHRKDFLEIKTAAIIIQRKFRSSKQVKRLRTDFLTLKKATIFIQRRFRANRLFKDHKNAIRSAAITIQRRFRARQQSRRQRLEFLSLKTAAVVIQRRFRANKLAKNQREKFIKIKSAAIVIQRKFRASLLTKDQRQKFLTLKTSAIIIQRIFRAKKLANKHRQDFISLKSAVITIQQRFRANRLSVCRRKEFTAIKSAAIIIQRRFKANRIAKDQRNYFIAIRTAAVTVQRNFRAIQLSRHQRQYFLALKTATVVIQRRFRANKLAKHQRQQFIKIKTAALLIQRKFRASRLSKDQMQKFLALKITAIKVQRRFRANKLANKKRQDFLSMKSAVITIQGRFRANKLAKNQRQDFIMLKTTVVTIQRKFRARILSKDHREKFLKLKAATVTIQRRFRARLLSIDQRERFLKLKAATVTIQRRFRARLLSIDQRERFLTLKAATVTIQRRFRACLLSKDQREKFLKLKAATVTIQRRFRARLLSKDQREKFLTLKAATVTIQRRFRACLLSKDRKEKFLKLKAATVTIQRRFRAHILSKDQRKNFLKLKAATVTIQRRFRARLLSIDQRERFLTLKAATVSIQRRFKTCLLSKDQREKFLKLKAATVTIQRRFRARLLSIDQRGKFLTLKAATITIQRRFRACLLSKDQREKFLKLKAATVTIQRRFRARLLSKNRREKFLTLKAATVTIQRRFRDRLLSKDQRETFLKLKAATVTIQRRFRARLLSKDQREKFHKLKAATVTIQRRFKARLLSKDQREKFLKLKAATVIIQRRFKANRMGRNIDPSIEARKNAASIIQAIWRGYTVRKRIKVPQPKVRPSDTDTSIHTTQNIVTRGRHYLQVLCNYQKYSVAELQNILYNIDKITVLSADQCEYFVKNNAVKILYEILAQSNRAVGVDKCVELILQIILNLYRAPSTAQIVWEQTKETNGICRVFDLMMSFKAEKTSTVFCKACTVIWLIAQDPEKAKVIIKTPKVTEKYRYIVKSMKRNDQPGPSTCRKPEQSRISSKKPVSGTKRKFPALRPNWGNYFDDPRAFVDKSFALDCVMNVLKC